MSQSQGQSPAICGRLCKGVEARPASAASCVLALQAPATRRESGSRRGVVCDSHRCAQQVFWRCRSDFCACAALAASEGAQAGGGGALSSSLPGGAQLAGGGGLVTQAGGGVGPPLPGAEKVDPALKEILERVAINGEVMAAVSNKALVTEDGKYGMLETFVTNVKRAGVTNFLVIALDDHTAKAMESAGVAAWRAHPETMLQDKSASNHGISGLKFQFLKQFLLLGYHVLLSDVDIVTLQNPFEHLHRDVDIEGLSDGFDEKTAYGWNDGVDDASMGWARYAATMRIYVMNSGLFYLRSNERTVQLMDRCTAKLASSHAWDQVVLNEMMWYPSHGKYDGVTVSKRIMDIHDFVNSKMLFKYMRKDARWRNHKPVMVHVNYHPDKWDRMKAIVKRWVDGDAKALDPFPNGSCKGDAPKC